MSQRRLSRPVQLNDRNNTSSSVYSAPSFHSAHSDFKNHSTQSDAPPAFRRADSDLEGGDQRKGSDSTKLGAFSKLTSMLSPNSLIPDNQHSSRKQSDATLIGEEDLEKDDDKYTSFKNRSRTLRRISQVGSQVTSQVSSAASAVPILSALQRTRRPSEIRRNVEGTDDIYAYSSP